MKGIYITKYGGSDREPLRHVHPRRIAVAVGVRIVRKAGFVVDADLVAHVSGGNEKRRSHAAAFPWDPIRSR